MGNVETAGNVILERGWLSKTPEPFQQAVLKHCVRRRYKAGASIYRKDDPPGGLFGLVRGGVAVDITTADRGPAMAHYLLPGAWFGGGPAFTGRLRQVGLRATRPSDLLYLPLHAINAIAVENANAWRCFALISYINLEVAMSVSDDLRRREHTKRLVAMLLHLGGCRDETPPEPGPVEIDVGQADLAAMANVARNTAGTCLRRLAKAGSIEMSYRCIRILEPDLLRQTLARRSAKSRLPARAR